MFSEGFGSSDSQWSTFVELGAEPLRQLMDPEVSQYFYIIECRSRWADSLHSMTRDEI